MEVPIIPKNIVQKTETPKTQAVNAKKAYAAGAAKKADSDAIQISSKSKLMQKLRTQYDGLEKNEMIKAAEVREKLEDGTLKLSSEEIVQSILHGTIFETI